MSAGIGAGLLGGAIGGGLAVTVLAPLTAANNFLGSYFFGSGMILGERQMYQDDWIKIKKRLDAGESFLVILEEVMKPNTQAVMQMARETVIAVSDEWNEIVLEYIKTIPQAIFDAIDNLGKGIFGDEAVNKSNLTYEEWLRGDPPKNVPPTTQKHVHSSHQHDPDVPPKEQTEKIIQTGKDVQAAKWLILVGSNKTRAQLMGAIKKFQTIIDASWKQVLKWRTGSGENRASAKKREEIINVWEISKSKYKEALGWVNKNNKNTPPQGFFS